MRTEIDLNECEHFIKANLELSLIDPSSIYGRFYTTDE